MNDPGMDISALVRRARSAEPGASCEVLERIKAPLLRRIRFMMGDEARLRMESGDVLQQVFVKFLEVSGADEIASEEHLIRWLARTARHFILDSVRRKREAAVTNLLLDSGLISLDRSGDPVRAARSLEAMDSIASAVGDLSADAQRVIELRYFEYLSFKEIGIRMDRSENATQLLHARALARLGHRLRALDSDSGSC